MRLILRLLINAAALWVAAELLDGIELEGSVVTILIVALVFGLINAVLKPLLKLLSLPVMILTLGLFALVINAALLLLTAAVTDGLLVDGFVAAVLGSIVISIVSAVLNMLIPDED
jgi:putative membrane protein